MYLNTLALTSFNDLPYREHVRLTLIHIQHSVYSILENTCIVRNPQPRSQGFSLFVIGKAGKGPGTGRSHDFQHPDSRNFFWDHFRWELCNRACYYENSMQIIGKLCRWEKDHRLTVNKYSMNFRLFILLGYY